jgi:hypothetical protein
MSDDDALLAMAQEQSREPHPGTLRLADIAEVTLQT